jgi:hypothetical protein
MGAWNWMLGGDLINSKSFFDRNIWTVNSEAAVDFLSLTFFPGFYYNSADTGIRGNEYSFYLKTKEAILDNQWIDAAVSLNRLEVNNMDELWVRADARYINMMFRDFSFLAAIGYWSDYGESFTVEGRISGDLFDTGYSVFIEQKNINTDLFVLLRSFPFLELSNLYKAEVVFDTGISLAKKFEDIADFGFGFKFSRIKNYLILVKPDPELFVDNFSGETDIVEFSFSAERDRSKLYIYYYTPPSRNLPYFVNSLNIVLSPYFNVLGRKLTVNNIMNFISDQEIWRDNQGIDKINVDSYFSFDLEVDYEVMENLDVRLGVENLFGQEVLPKGGFLETVPRYYLLASFGIQELYKGKEKNYD